nr:MAG TPA: hypothetical protein [Caudoviricetes sp.]
MGILPKIEFKRMDQAMQNKNLPLHGKLVLYAIAFFIVCAGISLVLVSI